MLGAAGGAPSRGGISSAPCHPITVGWVLPACLAREALGRDATGAVPTTQGLIPSTLLASMPAVEHSAWAAFLRTSTGITANRFDIAGLGIAPIDEHAGRPGRPPGSWVERAPALSTLALLAHSRPPTATLRHHSPRVPFSTQIIDHFAHFSFKPRVVHQLSSLRDADRAVHRGSGCPSQQTAGSVRGRRR